MSIQNSISMVAAPESELFPEASLRHGDLPLALIGGLHQEAEAELRRSGIATAENLAMANPLALLASSSLTLEQLVDWIGQALLLNYFGEDKAALLRRYGIRTVQNLLVLWQEPGPPPEIIRILCRSEDQQTVSFLGAMLRSDPFITRLLDLQDPQHGPVTGMVLEASAAARDFAKTRNAKDSWFESLKAETEQAYRELPVRDRLASCNPAFLLGGALLAIWSCAALLHFAGGGLDALGDLMFGTHPLTPPGAEAFHFAGAPPGTRALLSALAAIVGLATLGSSFATAFLVTRASLRAQLLFKAAVLLGCGLALGLLS